MSDGSEGSTRRGALLAGLGLLVAAGWGLGAAGVVSWAAVVGWLAARAVSGVALLCAAGLLAAGAWSVWGARRPAAPGRVRVALSWWVVAAALVVVVVVSWVTTVWLLHEAAHAVDVAATRVDAIKTGLGIGAGTGGVFALLLAVRRQWHQELTAADTAADATERRVTELYTKAADQLGSDKAPVRLAGLYALERLAQSTPGQRQTVVNVLCAYLRMPYLHPEPLDAGTGEISGSEASSAETGGANPEPDLELERRTQELQVRLAAQTILAAHLRAGPDRADPRHWPGTDLNLSGAVLVELDFTDCHLREADFIAARFVGDARFIAARFVGNAWFGNAEFSGNARFEKAKFGRVAEFGNAEFGGDARFDVARFDGNARFEKAKFGRVAGFVDAEFGGDAKFDAAEFDGGAWFRETKFGRRARFGNAEFDEDAWFEKAKFSGDAWFREAKFGRVARFGNAEFSGDVRFMDVVLGQGGVFDGAEFARADAVLPAPWRLVASDRPGWFKAMTTPPAPDPASPAPATPEPGD